jgi:putative phosphoribosyl transferase
MTRFRDRTDAGRALAKGLKRYAGHDDVVVLALPRGGVPVAFEVASALSAPLHVFLVRKLGAPGHEEYAIGAIASGGVEFINEEVVRALGVPPATLRSIIAREKRELERRQRAYAGHDLPAARDHIAILIDDGLATGSTMRAAVVALRQQQPSKIVVAVPVAAASTCADFESLVEEVVCLRTPEPFFAVGEWYEDFSQTTDEEVRDLLSRASHLHPVHAE